MKSLLKLALAVICAFSFAQTVYANESAVLNSEADFTVSFGSATSIADQNRGTKAKISGEAEINIETLNPAYSLYLVWDKYPQSWALEANGITIAQSSDTKMLHEYISSFYDRSSTQLAPAPTRHTSMTLTVNGGTLCDIYVFGQGEVPDFVQQWSPPYDDADMLLLPTHADDEHLYFGGTMPTYSSDKKVQVAYFTVHSGEIYRQHELLDGLYTVGIRAYPVFSEFSDYYADSIEQAKGLYDEETAVNFISTLLVRFKPEVVIGHDINGEYGHGVHKYNTYCLQKALEQGADSIDGHQVLKTYLHLYEENSIEMNWDIPLEQFQGKTAFEMAVAGFAKHKSQQKYFKVEETGPYDCRKFGLYDSHVGVDVNKNDFFENITETMYSDYVAPPPPPVESASSQSQSAVSSVPPEENKPQKSEFDLKPWYIVIPICFLPLILLAFNKKKK